MLCKRKWAIFFSFHQLYISTYRFGGDEDDVRPPGLQDDEEFGDEREEEEEADEKRGGGRSAAPAPNSLQRKMLEMAGQDLDQFMKVNLLKKIQFK